MRSSLTFALVEWFAGIVPPPVVTSVSAGSHMTGSHTAALDSNGTLYTWGKASACGHIGSRQSLSDAASNAFSTLFTTNAGATDSNGPIVYPRVVSAFKNRPVIKISCGGGFCVAVACEPKVRMDKNEDDGDDVLAEGVEGILTWS
jgi:alpha-tubulin suppressor-like RCC1 family protein